MGKHNKVCCNICLRVMRSDHLNQHLKVHERREETSKPHHQFYNYNIFKNIELYKEKTTMPNQHKQVSCNICFKSMRSDHLNRHMKVHVKRNESYPTTKRKFEGEQYTQDDQPSIKRKCGENMIDVDELRKTLIERTDEYNGKVALGEQVYKILGEGEVKQGALPKDMQEALELYEKEKKQF